MNPPVSSHDFWSIACGLLFFAVVAGIPLLIFSWVFFFLLSIPFRRQERARIFLQLVDNCLRQGRPIEPALVEMAASRDRSPGVLFHLFAAHIEEGCRFGEALRKVPQMLPPSVNAMLVVGDQLGDLRTVMPACQMQLDDARSKVSGALHFFMAFALGLAPLVLFLFSVISFFVAPKLKDVMRGMFMDMPGRMGSFGELHSFWIGFYETSLHYGMWVECLFMAAALVLIILYQGGPALTAKLRFRSLAFVDAIAWQVPWKRLRMQRDFAAMLAILQDHGVPEPEALKLAAGCAANEIFRRKAVKAAALLEQGAPLAEAVHALDGAGEFRWRLTNAAHGHGGFMGALRGWLDALDARAFQREQAAAHLLSTSLILINGLVVGCICAGLFGMLSNIIEMGALW
jgi:general secretion pathway protein F